ncbi:MAG: hypothetical protein ACRC7J_15795 [Vibrio ordalii]|uniref:hypothetical protein n=1 Tax=Vibrio ordalii TaxID=28174 RepID=UPI003F3D4E2D
MSTLFPKKEIYIFFSDNKKRYFLSTNQEIANKNWNDQHKKDHYLEFTKERTGQLNEDMKSISSESDFSVETVFCYSHEECLSKIRQMKVLGFTQIGGAPKFSSKSWSDYPKNFPSEA